MELPTEQDMSGNATTDITKLTKDQRYHLLNREVRLQKQHEKYINRPDVIAKREERERKKAEKEAQKQKEKEERVLQRRMQTQLALEEKIKLAAETKRVRKPKKSDE
jgi:hypothetical protein